MVRTQNKPRAAEGESSLLHHQSNPPDVPGPPVGRTPLNRHTLRGSRRRPQPPAAVEPPRRPGGRRNALGSVPAAERNPLLVTMHHGHLQGAKKCKGDRKWCATCLKAGHEHEDTATHTAHECPVAREVWAKIAKAWENATGEHLDVTRPHLTVLGLRPAPPQAATPPDRARHKATEPA